MFICAACHHPIVGEDESNPHSGHEERCPNYQQWPGLIVPCNCDVRYHAACCPDCDVPNEENAVFSFCRKYELAEIMAISQYTPTFSLNFRVVSVVADDCSQYDFFLYPFASGDAWVLIAIDGEMPHLQEELDDAKTKAR